MFGSKKSKAGQSPPVPADADKKTPPAAAASETAPPVTPSRAAAAAANNGLARSGTAAPAGQTVAASPQQRQASAVAIRQTVAFSQIVSILMRSAFHKHLALSDLEWLVLPPLMAGQFRVAQARAAQDAPSVPAAVALWAKVSPEVDRRLTENPSAPTRLRPDEWRSGDILWLIEVVGDPRVVPQLMKSLGDSVFKGRDVKMKARGADGKPTAKVVRPAEGSRQPTKAE